MLNTNAIGGVATAGMANSAGNLHVAAATAHPAHTAFAGHAAGAAAQRMRRTATATDASVDRGTS